MKIQEKSESFCFSHKFPAFEAIIYRTGFLDIRYLLGLSIYLLISTRCRYSHGFGSLDSSFSEKISKHAGTNGRGLNNLTIYCYIMYFYFISKNMVWLSIKFKQNLHHRQ